MGILTLQEASANRVNISNDDELNIESPRLITRKFMPLPPDYRIETPEIESDPNQNSSRFAKEEGKEDILDESINSEAIEDDIIVPNFSQEVSKRNLNMKFASGKLERLILDLNQVPSSFRSSGQQNSARILLSHHQDTVLNART